MPVRKGCMRFLCSSAGRAVGCFTWGMHWKRLTLKKYSTLNDGILGKCVESLYFGRRRWVSVADHRRHSGVVECPAWPEEQTDGCVCCDLCKYDVIFPIQEPLVATIC